MSDEPDDESKTEDPTPRRREEARKAGQVPFSAELVGALVLLSGIVGFGWFGESIGSALSGAFRHDLRRSVVTELPREEAEWMMRYGFLRMIAVLLPLFGVALVVGVTASVAQVGFQINTEKLGADFEKLNPAKGFQRLFSLGALVKGGLTIMKIVALALISYWIIEQRGGLVANLSRQKLVGATVTAWALVLRLATYLAAAIAGIALIDYLYQRNKFEKSLRMTKQELKEELKQEDGDPHIKGRFRQIARDRATRKMLREIPKATVVVTNPTHYSVALRYDSERDAAPVVVAKAVGATALRIRKLARDAGVPIVERPPLARALYAGVKEGKQVPTALFRAVAEVLAFVYRMRGTVPTESSRSVSGEG